MFLTRRELLGAGALTLAAAARGAAMQGAGMYGLIGKFTAVDGKRDELVQILLESTGAMPGCLSYIVATDPADANAIWITEAWDSQASHDASLTLPAVRAAIGKARPLIAAMGSGTVTSPVGGHGLLAAKP
jgi:quinol monooxygenase YgiN